MDPVTIAAAIAFLSSLAVVVVAITTKKIVEWFRSRGKIKERDARLIAFTLAERIENKQYVEVPGVFGNAPSNTRIVQGFYDPAADKVVDARAMASASPPKDKNVITQHVQGDGLVVYT